MRSKVNIIEFINGIVKTHKESLMWSKHVISDITLLANMPNYTHV